MAFWSALPFDIKAQVASKYVDDAIATALQPLHPRYRLNVGAASHVRVTTARRRIFTFIESLPEMQECVLNDLQLRALQAREDLSTWQDMHFGFWPPGPSNADRYKIVTETGSWHFWQHPDEWELLHHLGALNFNAWRGYRHDMAMWDLHTAHGFHLTLDWQATRRAMAESARRVFPPL